MFSIMFTLSISSCKINSSNLSSEQSKDINVFTYEEETEEVIYLDSNENLLDEEGSLSGTEAFEFYSDLDALGRCGQACANICPEIQPTEEKCYWSN